MKNLLLALLVFVSISISAQTTQEEYNYVTKGLKAQYANGLDMKKGYTLELYEKAQYNNNVYVSYYLLKKDTVISSIVVAFGKELATATNFYCIPSFYSEKLIWDQFNTSIYSDKTAGTTTYILLKTTAFVLSKALTGNQQ